MPSHEQIRQVVGEWVEKAEHSIMAAHSLFEHGEDSLVDIVCFHAQQGVEKYLKAILVQAGIPVPKTHDIEKIVALLPSEIKIGLSLEEMRTLTSYAVEYRYPGHEPLALPDAKEAVDLANRIRDEVRSLLQLY